MKRILTQPVFWIVVFTLLPLWALLVPGLPLTHDGQDHVARIANFYQSLAEGNIVPRWAANLNWGYGHSILMFLYPLPSYIASFFHLLGFSLLNSTKLVFGLTFVASALTMYFWMKSEFGKIAGLVGSLLYCFAPYRFVDLYVRGALGEHVAFVFPPLVLFFLYRLAHEQKITRNIFNSIGLSVSLALLILAHNAIAIMFFPVIGLYALYLWQCEAKDKRIFLFLSVIGVFSGFGLSCFFWFPAYFEGKYTLRDIVTAGEAMKNFVQWTWFFYSPWNYGGTNMLTKSLGISQWVGVAGGIVFIWKTKKQNLRLLLIGAVALLAVSLFLMTAWSDRIWITVTLLQKFQFPWRFLSVSLFAAAVMGGIAVSQFLYKRKYNHLFLILFCILIIGLTVFMWHPQAYLLKRESFFTGVYASTTDTGESSPIWSIRFMEHTPLKPMEVITGSATVTPVFRNTTIHVYQVTVSEPSRLVENTLYFPGWNIYIDGVATDLQFQDPDYRGLMTFRMSQGGHVVKVMFSDTKLRRVANIVSIVSMTLMILSGISVIIWRKTKT
jgi:hypothetical protein